MLGDNFVPEKTMPCYRCGGTGEVAPQEYENNSTVCPRCHGTKIVPDNPHVRACAVHYKEILKKAAFKRAVNASRNGRGSFPSTGGMEQWCYEDGSIVLNRDIPRRKRH